MLVVVLVYVAITIVAAKRGYELYRSIVGRYWSDVITNGIACLLLSIASLVMGAVIIEYCKGQ